MSGPADRLKQIRDSLGYTQEAMADLLGMKKRTYQEYERGKSSPQLKDLAPLAGLGVDINWLLTGRGEMVADRGTDAVGVIRDRVRRLPEGRRAGFSDQGGVAEFVGLSWDPHVLQDVLVTALSSDRVRRRPVDVQAELIVRVYAAAIAGGYNSRPSATEIARLIRQLSGEED